MPVRACTPKAEAATDAASARVNGHGHRLGRVVDQPDYASPPFRIVRSCCVHAFGGSKGSIVRISSAIGFTAPLAVR